MLIEIGGSVKAITLLMIITIALATVMMITIGIFIIITVKITLLRMITVLTKIYIKGNCNIRKGKNHKYNDKDYRITKITKMT